MKTFRFTKRQSDNKHARPASPPVILPMESRQMMSIAAPAFPLPPDGGYPTAEAFAFNHDIGNGERPGPAFGQIGEPQMPGFVANLNGLNIPLGLIGSNLVSEPSAVSFGANFDAAPAVSAAVRLENAMPAIPTSMVAAGTTQTMADSYSTPGSGLSFLVSQIIEARSVPAATAAAVTDALAGLSEFSNSAALSASSTFHAQASAIAQKLEGVVSMLGGLNLDGRFETLPRPLQALSAAPTVSVDAPSAPPVIAADTHRFADGVAGIEAVARSVGEAFLQTLVSDLVQFETALTSDSMMNELGHSLTDWRGTAVAGAVLAFGAYLQKSDDEKKTGIDDAWLGCPIGRRPAGR